MIVPNETAYNGFASLTLFFPLQDGNSEDCMFLQVYAVEKNPNAVITLQNLVISEG